MKRTVSGILFVLLLASTLTAAFNVQSARVNASSLGEIVQATGTDWWPMFHHDLSHTGTSTSTAPNTNQTSWNYATGSYVVSSPAVAGGVVYVGSADNKTYALNATTGTQVWNYTTGAIIQWSSPAVVGGVVYVGSTDGNVYALNATTGTQVWNYATAGEVWSSPAVVGGVVYVGSWDGNVYALSTTTGTLVWKTTGWPVVSSPAVVGGVVYVGSTDNNVYALNAATGTQVWNYTTGSAVYSSPAVVGGLVYVGSCDHNVYCLNAATGALVWNYTTGGSVFSSPAVVGGVVYVGSDDGNVYALNATTGTQVWKHPTGNWVQSSPAVAGGMVFVGSWDNNVYALNATTGTQVWSYTTGGPVFSSPAVVGGVIYVGSLDGKIYAFGPPAVWPAPAGVQWSRTYGGAGDECAFSIVQTMDGGYALGGCTNSYGAGGYDFWLVKTDAAGNVQWNQTYGTPDDDWCYSIIQTSDGGYALAGLSYYDGFHGLLVKTDEFGNMLWSKTYVGPYPGGASLLYSVVQTSDGGYAMAGFAYTGAGPYDFWLVKTDASGNVQWSNTYGGAGNDIAYSVIQTNDGGYALAGHTTSYGTGKADFFLVKTDPSGTLQEWMAYGGAGDDIAHSVIQTNDGGYALAGYTDSYGSGGTDGLLVKADEFGHMEWNNTYGGSKDDHVYSAVQTPDGRYLMAGDTSSYGAGDYDCWFVTVNENGTMLEDMTFGGAGPEFACSVTLTSDGGYIAYGESKPSGLGPCQTIAVKYKPKEYTFERKKMGPKLEKLNQHIAACMFPENITPPAGLLDNFCGPTSAAACLAWFAEANTGKYGRLIPDLDRNGRIDTWEKYAAAYAIGQYMGTDITGTTDANFIRGLENYIENAGLGNKFTVTPIWNPSYQRVKDEFKKGQDVLVGIGDDGVGHWVVVRGMNENPTDGSYDVSFMDPWDGSFTDSQWTPKAGPDFDELSPDCDLDGNLSTIPKVELIVSVCPQGDPPYNQTLTGYAVESNGHTYVITGTDFNEVYVNNGQVFGVIGGTVYNTTGTVYGFANRTVGIVNGTYFPVTGSAYIINGSQAQNRPSIPLHDVEVTDVQPFKTVVGAGFSLSVNVTVANGGNQNETFYVTAYANATLHQRKTITLTSGNSTTITFTWNTTGFVKGNYTIGAYAWPVPGETDKADNTLPGGWVIVTIPGDVDGNFEVDIYDITAICVCYDSKIGPPSDPLYYPNCDLDGNGIIDIFDVTTACITYGQKYP